jgi:hypothetical protein
VLRFEWTAADHYGAYEAARGEAEEALAHWCTAPAAHRREAFAVYRAAAEREYAAAVGWLEACRDYDEAAAA